MASVLLVGCLAGIVGFALPVGAAPDRPDPAVVRTDTGPVRGTVTGDHRTFLGIPYAAPPVGPLRWADPEPPTPWTAIRDATSPGNACPQSGSPFGDRPSDTEDCLYLNVTTPGQAEGDRLPVLVWLHGGAFIAGAGSNYGAERLAARGGVVVVTVNYRLGVFGFLAHPALDGGPGQDRSGNYWLADQQAALRWVRRNAAAFGGDPGNVTVAGESSGGTSGCAHLVAPGSAGLFQRVIAQSGPCTQTTLFVDPAAGSSLPRPRAVAERDGLALATELGCADPASATACLRALPVPQLLQATMPLGGLRFGPVVGGGALPIDPARALATGQFARVPVMVGTNRDEHRLFVAADEIFSGHPLTAADYARQLTLAFGTAGADRVLARYPVPRYGSPALALATAWTDYAWACPALRTERLLARHVPTYGYDFADERAPWLSALPTPGFPTGAYHMSDLPYLFASGYQPGQLTPDQQALSDRMIGYWTRFARTGDPNGLGAPSWAPFQPGSRNAQRLSPDQTGPVDLGVAHRCGFWRTLNR